MLRIQELSVTLGCAWFCSLLLCMLQLRVKIHDRSVIWKFLSLHSGFVQRCFIFIPLSCSGLEPRLCSRRVLNQGLSYIRVKSSTQLLLPEGPCDDNSWHKRFLLSPTQTHSQMIRMRRAAAFSIINEDGVSDVEVLLVLKLPPLGSNLTGAGFCSSTYNLDSILSLKHKKTPPSAADCKLAILDSENRPYQPSRKYIVFSV